MESTSLHQKLVTLRSRCAHVDKQVATLVSLPVFDQLKVQRLKRQRIKLRGELAEIERELTPDISA